MRLSDTLIWVYDSFLADPEVIEAIKGFGGIAAFGTNGLALAKNYPEQNNLYNFGTCPTVVDIEYLGEYGTRRQIYPVLNNVTRYFADESSLYRLAKSVQSLAFLTTGYRVGYSSYRPTLFTIPTKNTDWNIRIPILSPIWTLKRLNNKYGARHRFVWLDLKLNLNFCYLRKTYLNPDDEKNKIKNWGAKSFMKIPFQFHVKNMIKFCDKYGKRLMIYSADYDVTKEQLLERIAIIKKYLS